MSMVDLFLQKPHCDSGYTLPAKTWGRFTATRAKQFSNNAEEGDATVIAAVASIAFVFV